MYIGMKKDQLSQVAKHLGSEARVVEKPHGDHTDCFIVYKELEVHFTTNTSDRNQMWCVRIGMPQVSRDANDYRAKENWGSLTTTINVGIKKTDEQIARDIERRFDWEALGNVKNEFLNVEADYMDATVRHKEFVDQIVALCPKDWRVNRKSNTETHIDIKMTDDGYGDIDISYQTVRFDLRSFKNKSIVYQLIEVLKRM